MTSIAVNDDNFEAEVINSDTPVIVDFWAEWCGPCKAMSPLVDELAGEMAGKVKVVKVNIDESPNAPTKYGVRGIPTFMVFKGGEVAETKVGGMSKDDLKAWAESAA
jgi:thioredoxin 1